MTKKELRKALLEEIETYIRCSNSMWSQFVASHYEDKVAERLARGYKDKALTISHLMKHLVVINEKQEDELMDDIISRTCQYQW